MKKSPVDSQYRVETRRAWLIGVILLLCYSYFFYLGGNWNIESRYAQIYALAERGTLVIDSYPFLTPGGGDAARYQGHYYSDKLIGPSLVAAPFYLVARHVLTASGQPFDRAVYFALRITNVVTNALPSALLGAVLYLFLANFGLAPKLRVWLALGYGLGTLAFPYSTLLFGHQLAAVSIAFAFMLLWRQRSEWSSRRAIAAAAFAGFAAISDAMGVFVAFFLGLYALWLAATVPAPSARPELTRVRSRGNKGAQVTVDVDETTRVSVRTAVTRVVPFAAVVLAIFAVQLAANWSSFGNPLTFPHIYHAQAAFRARHRAGFFGIHLPHLYPLYQLTVGPWRGLFYGSPMLLLALPGFFLLGRKWRAESLLIAGSWLWILLLNAGYENWTTGSAYGPRYQIVVLPLLILALAPAAKRWPLVFKTLALVSIAFTALVTAQSPLLPEALRNPLANALAQFAQGNLSMANVGLLFGLPGLGSLLPLAAVVGGLLVALRGMGEREAV